MGANPTQAQGVLWFLLAFVLISIGLASGGSFVWIAIGLALVGVSCAFFLKCKPWEHGEE